MSGTKIVKLSKEHIVWLAGLFSIAVFAFILFGLAGFRAVAAIAVLFVASVLVLLRNVNLDFGEKVFFSLFISIGLFPLLVWYINQALPSFRVSMVAALAIVASAGFFAPRLSGRLRKKKL